MRPLLLTTLLVLVACGKDDPEDTHDTGTPSVDNDGDGYPEDEDCDDWNIRVNPGADEECDFIDNDCDGLIDEDDPDLVDIISWYPDNDDDGWADDADPGAAVESCKGPDGYADKLGDCDDEDASINPGAEEVCDGVDNDCSGAVDDADDALEYWPDVDGDGYGDDSASAWFCEEPSGYVLQAGDCDDGDAAINPDGTEVCDGADNDCDGSTDGSDAEGQSTWYRDSDGDGVGARGQSTQACDQPTGYVPAANGEDCDDSEAAAYPGATEICDDIDNDCNGPVDDNPVDAATWYRDSDGDGYGANSSTREACDQPSGYVAVGGDCNDGRASAHPGGTEVCDGVDNDCDGTTDPASSADAATWYRDSDGDGYGLSGSSTVSCNQPTGYASRSADCDDGDAAINPGAAELCDGVDNNCDGSDDSANTVTFVAGSGAITDLSTTLRGGSTGSPVSYRLGSAGTLTFCPGIYYVNLELAGSSVSLVGSDGAGSTTLSGGGAGSIVTTASNASSVRLEGLTLQRGDAPLGGAFVSNNAGLSLEIYDCAFDSNDATSGGAIAVEGASIYVENSSFDDNQADNYGGVLYAVDSDVELVDCTLDANAAAQGGALYLEGGTVLLDVTLGQENDARSNGSTSLGSGESVGGAGAYLAGGAHLACTASVSSDLSGFLLGEAFGEGGAVWVGTGSSMESSMCDWAAVGGSYDNTPSDIWVQATSSRYDFENNDYFSCDDSGCQ
jgi:hypothetical protein